MATPLDDSQSTPTAQNTPPAWTDWQAMRFLYQDVNSLLYGGGLDLQQFTLPSLNLPNYFNTFSLIQGIGSTNSGAGTTNQPGGGGGSIVLQCDLCNFARTMPPNDVAQYIYNQGLFSISAFASTIFGAGQSVINLADLGSPGQPISCTPPPSILLGSAATSFSPNICPPHNCSNINSISLNFSATASISAVAGILTGLFCSFTEWIAVATIDVNYVLSASMGLGNTYHQSGAVSTLFPGGYTLNIVGSHSGVLNNVDQIKSSMLQFIRVFTTDLQPTLINGFNNILLQAPCSC